MLVSKINSTNFKAVRSDIRTNTNSTVRQNIIKNSIEKKLNRPYPNDSKNRSYAEFLEEEHGLDIIISSAKEGSFSPVMVTAEKWRSKNNESFVVGEYNSQRFKPEDVLNAHKEYKFSKGISLFAFLATAAAFTFLLISGHKMNSLEKGFQQKAIELTEKLPDTLKNVVK